MDVYKVEQKCVVCGIDLDPEITELLNNKADSIGRTLRRMRTKNQVVKLEDDSWGLYSK